MTTADKTQRLAVRYEILERLPGEDFKVRKDALGVATGWVLADPGYTGYKNDQVVSSVTQGATYRVRVRFRWTDATGHVVARTTRITNACKQKETRPDLRINKLSVQPGPGPASRRYVALVRNLGRTAAGSFDVLLSVGGRELSPHRERPGARPAHHGRLPGAALPLGRGRHRRGRSRQGRRRGLRGQQQRRRRLPVLSGLSRAARRYTGRR